MNRILALYDSEYGSTADAAKIIAETLVGQGLHVDLGPVGSEDPAGYDAVLVGSPIRLGQCTSGIKKFLKRNKAALASMPVAFFFTCMSVVDDNPVLEFPLHIDPVFNDPNKPRTRIKLVADTHAASYYLKQLFKILPGISPLDVAFFKGRLDMSRLSMLHRLVMRFAMFALPEVREGDYLNETGLREWAERLAARLNSA